MLFYDSLMAQLLDNTLYILNISSLTIHYKVSVRGY